MRARSKLAVILHADVVGSTQLVQRDERVAHERMQVAFRHLSDAIARYDGRTHELRGDALLAEFARASDAVCAALAFQDENRIRNVGLADNIRPQIRIGIALGEIIIADGTLTGAGVVLAQRLEQLAESDGLCISAAIREALPARLPFEYGSLGEQKVKGFDEPVRVFLVTLGQDGAVPMPEPSVSAPPSRHRIKKTIAALLVIIAGAGLGTWIALPSLFVADALSPPSLGVPRLSIAVLPFANPGGDAEQDYFAEALTEDLTADLSRIAGSFVIARSTTATYRGRDMDAKRIARELGVRYVLQGTVRRAETQVRIGVQLIDGETGQQVWSERYEKAAGDMYTFQNEVTGRIARALNLELKDALSRQAARGRPGDLDSADLALRAWAQLWTKPQSPTTNAAALTYVERALAIDPDNAEALGVQAYAYARAATYGWGEGSRVDLIRKGITAGERSIALDPKNADAVYALGFLYFIAGETARSQEMLRQCIALNRNHAPAYFCSGINLLRLGHPRDAILWIERAFALSPRDPLRSVWYGTIARARVALGEDAAAIEAANKGIAANANHSHNYAALAAALAHLGRMNEARVAIEAFKRVQPGITISRYQHNVAGDDPIAQKTYERLMSGLLKAGLPA